MLVEIEKLISVTNFAKKKNLSRQHVYRLANNEELTLIMIDDVAFILIDEKAVNFVRKRKEKIYKQK
jgi:hypothetical protein